MTVEGAQVYNLANTQFGKRYIFGSEVAVSWWSFYHATSWDCSELVQVVCNLLGIGIPDGSQAQRSWCHPHISLERAKHIKGALLFSSHHVAISDGNGGTIEAANHLVGVIHGRIDSRFTDAALIPGVHYPELSGGDPAPAPDVPPPAGSLAEFQRAVFFAKLFRFGQPDGPGVLNEHSPGADKAIQFLQAGINGWGKRWAALTHTAPPQPLTSGRWDDLTRLCVDTIQRITGHNELGVTGPQLWESILPS